MISAVKVVGVDFSFLRVSVPPWWMLVAVIQRPPEMATHGKLVRTRTAINPAKERLNAEMSRIVTEYQKGLKIELPPAVQRPIAK